MADGRVTAAIALRRSTDDLHALVPATIRHAGKTASRRWIEFFTAHLRNANTRAAYLHACTSFLTLTEREDLALVDVEPFHVAAYIESMGKTHSAPTVKQHLAALRGLFDYLVVGQVIPFNPAAAVRGPKHSAQEGKTPVLSDEETRALFAQFDDTKLIDLRDRALLAVMAYSFARVGAVVKLRVQDYYRQGPRAWFVLAEKGGKHAKVPAHHQAAAYVEAYLERAGDLGRETPLFRSFRARSSDLSDRALHRADVFAMIRRRAAAVGLPLEVTCHSFRATGITNYLVNGGQLETAQKIAGHASTKTTQLYDRRGQQVAQAEIERIRF